MRTFLALDAGTTALKAALFDEHGRQLALDRQEYTLLTPFPAVVELPAETYWQAAVTAVRATLAHSGAAPETVATLCISSQGETFVPIDVHGRPVTPAITWLDNRAADEAQAIAEHFGLDEIFWRTGQPDVTPGWPACKFLWLRNRSPEAFARIHKFLLLEDYLLYHLTGQCVTSAAQQTSSLLLNIVKGSWWPEMMDFVGVTPGHFGTLCQPGSVVGSLTPQGAAALGLTPRTLAIAGAMDQATGAVGAGNIAPGMVVESTGGALGVVATLDAPCFDPHRRIPCYIHAVPHTFCLLPWGQTAGMALKWLRDNFFALESAAAIQHGCDPYDVLTAEAAAVPPGCDGLTVLPHLEGAFCPEFNPDARAVFFGATLRHGRAHFTRGILEAVAFMLKRQLDLVAALGIPVSEIRSLGGGARSSLWLQIKADVLQKAVCTIATEEAACLGAAMLGAVAAGAYPTLAEAAAQMVQTKALYQPNPAHAVAYAEAYRRYIKLYERLEPLFSKE